MKCLRDQYGARNWAFQSYLTGIEIIYIAPYVLGAQRSNRTLLELKLAERAPKSESIEFQSYLTGIEIKRKASRRKQEQVPIVPYWNWNEEPVTPDKPAESRSNRTLLELKCAKANTTTATATGSNRTLLELKYWMSVTNDWGIKSSNRTLLELKSIRILYNNRSKAVPIVPYWNWNNTIDGQPAARVDVPIVPYWNWNRYSSGWNGNGLCSNRTLLELKYLENRARSYEPWASPQLRIDALLIVPYFAHVKIDIYEKPFSMAGRGHGVFCNLLVIRCHFKHGVEKQPFFGHVSTPRFITHCKSTSPETERGRVP